MDLISLVHMWHEGVVLSPFLPASWHFFQILLLLRHFGDVLNWLQIGTWGCSWERKWGEFIGEEGGEVVGK